MVVNKGFSFSNIVGKYAIKEIKSNYTNRTTDLIISAIYPGNLKVLYSQNSYDEGSLAYEFSAINTDCIEEVIPTPPAANPATGNTISDTPLSIMAYLSAFYFFLRCFHLSLLFLCLCTFTLRKLIKRICSVLWFRFCHC